MMTKFRICCSAILGLSAATGLWMLAGQSPSKAASTSKSAQTSAATTKTDSAWPYAAHYDEVKAAGEVYHVRYEDQHIRLVEVAGFPGVHTAMHGDPYPAIIAIDAPMPKLENTVLDPKSPLNGQSSQQAPPPKGLEYPIGRSEAPMAPHSFTNADNFPLHYFKIEFKRIDGDDYPAHWKIWYPWMLNPIKPFANVDPRDPALGAPVSKEYPFAAATESYISAPNNHFVRYQDDHPSVFARDIGPSAATSGPTQPSATPPIVVSNAQNAPGIGHAGAGGDWKLDPNGTNGQGGGTCAAPTGMKWPNCSTMGPQWPHAASDTNAYPTHFYRIQFKRIDGDGIKAHWREWYPWMATLAVQYKDKTGSSGN